MSYFPLLVFTVIDAFFNTLCVLLLFRPYETLYLCLCRKCAQYVYFKIKFKKANQQNHSTKHKNQDVLNMTELHLAQTIN